MTLSADLRDGLHRTCQLCVSPCATCGDLMRAADRIEEQDRRIKELEAELEAHRNEIRRLDYWISTMGKAAQYIHTDAATALDHQFVEDGTP